METGTENTLDSVTVFKSRLKTFLFNQTSTEHWSDLPPTLLKLRPYGAVEIRLLLLFIVIKTAGKKTEIKIKLEIEH